MNVHKVLCSALPFMQEMDIGKTYCYAIKDGGVVEYWEDGEGFPLKRHMAVYAWANAVHVGELIPLSDCPPEED